MTVRMLERDLPSCHNKGLASFGSNKRRVCNDYDCVLRKQCFFANEDVQLED